MKYRCEKALSQGPELTGLSGAGINHRSSREEIAVEEMEAVKWDLSAGFPWSRQ